MCLLACVMLVSINLWLLWPCMSLAVMAVHELAVMALHSSFIYGLLWPVPNRHAVIASQVSYTGRIGLRQVC
jgi:hypothetical protein